MAEARPPDIVATFQAVRRFIDRVYPEHGAITIKVELPGEREAVIPVSGCRCDGESATPAAGQYSPIEEAILEALREAPVGEKLTGEDLARRSGYEWNGRLREHLAGLVRRGVIKNHRPGYSLE